MSSQLKAAIIGCGRMAGTIDDEVQNFTGIIFPYGHAGAYKLAAGVDLVAAADIDLARLAAFADRFEISQRFTDYQEMLAKVQPDIVSITTRTTERAAIILAAVAAGVRGIYAEKALACSLAEANAVYEACRRAGVAFNIGTSRRYDPAFRQVRELVKKGYIGTVHRALACAGGGGLMHTHSHTIDTLLFLLGDPQPLAVQSRLADHYTLDDGVLRNDPAFDWVHITCENNLRADMLAMPGRYDFEVSGSEGALLLYDNKASLYARRPGVRQQGQKLVWEIGDFPPFDATVSATLRAVNELVAAVTHGAPTSGDVEIARRQVQVGIAATQSHLEERLVPLSEVRPDIYIPSR